MYPFQQIATLFVGIALIHISFCRTLKSDIGSQATVYINSVYISVKLKKNRSVLGDIVKKKMKIVYNELSSYMNAFNCPGMNSNKLELGSLNEKYFYWYLGLILKKERA